MLTSSLLVALATFAFVTSITPGPNNLMLMTSGINFGFARTVPHMLGVAIGFTLMIVLVGAGMMRIFDAIPAAYAVIRIASVTYLVWMAWKIASAPTAPKVGAAAAARPFTFTQAALFQWVNPKAWTMALTAVSAYAPRDQPVLGLLAVALVFGTINLPSVGSWTLLGAKMRHFLADPAKMRAFNIVAALLLIGSLYPVVFGH